jgi:hypothetical protein
MGLDRTENADVNGIETCFLHACAHVEGIGGGNRAFGGPPCIMYSTARR